MAVTTPPPVPASTPLAQALARKRTSPLPIILLAVGLLGAVALAIFGYLESRRTEPVVIMAREVAYGQPITAEDLAVVELPLHRPAQLAGMQTPGAIAGQYAARDLGVNDVVQPAMLLAEPPGQPTYPNGQELTANMVPVPFATTTIGPITHRDRLNLGFSDTTGDPALCDEAQAAAAGEPTSISPITGETQPRAYACRLLSDIRVLYVDEAQGLAYLELTPYQAQTVWAIQASGLQLWGERYGSISDALPPLTRLDIGQVSVPSLTAPAPAPSEVDAMAENAAPAETAPAVPGSTSSIPGSRP
jgi:hypothetical protein